VDDFEFSLAFCHRRFSRSLAAARFSDQKSSRGMSAG
jgi:hypothetical protein